MIHLLLRNSRRPRAISSTIALLFCVAYTTHSSASTYDDLIELNPEASLKSEQKSVEHNKKIELPATSTLSDHPPKTLSRYKIAIIIDDIGYNHAQGMEAIALPGNITYAIIPHSPKANFFAQEAQKYNKEIMLHAPMSNVHNIPLGKHGLDESMDEVHFKEALNLSLDSLPTISGVNNHMGSLLTQKALPMEWLMQALGKRQLYFIDSRTTSNSVAWKTAQAFNIPSLKRDVFLDHQQTEAFIQEQFNRLVYIAKNKGYAVAIAHPYPETIRFLKQALPKLALQNIELVSASELVLSHSPNLMTQKYTKNVTQITNSQL